MDKMKNAPAKPELFPREHLENYAVRDMENRPVNRGDVVRRPPRVSEALGVQVPDLVGIVLDIFRRRGGEPMLELRLDRDNRCAGTAVVAAAHTKRSQAHVRGTTAEDWHG